MLKIRGALSSNDGKYLEQYVLYCSDLYGKVGGPVDVKVIVKRHEL